MAYVAKVFQYKGVEGDGGAEYRVKKHIGVERHNITYRCSDRSDDCEHFRVYVFNELCLLGCDLCQGNTACGNMSVCLPTVVRTILFNTDYDIVLQCEPRNFG